MSKQKVLTLNEKIRVLELSKSISARKIADEVGVGKNQIQNILKRKAEVLEDVENNVSGSDCLQVLSLTAGSDCLQVLSLTAGIDCLRLLSLTAGSDCLQGSSSSPLSLQLRSLQEIVPSIVAD
ncbi:hypothetical protein DPMN_153897 [Dreissena polymorpha]|uniref:HTH psq-type domain-containing protein n=1 Tax=Dreissena polymorpha TaxID=45954 RepID=A0A9D4FME2_DREPO|nr:hypothetical protein DPMN_153897 [Dreissena polymorpha]